MVDTMHADNEVLREQLMVFDTLARHFQNVYLMDLEKKTARILKLDADYVDVPGKEGSSGVSVRNCYKELG